MTFGQIADRVMNILSRNGVSAERKEILQVINDKLAELIGDASHQTDDISINSVADKLEYDLPLSGLSLELSSVNKVFVGTERANKMDWNNLEALRRQSANEDLNP